MGKGLQRDLMFGLRMLRKSPLLVIVATLSLGLGIGLNTTVFSAVHALLLRGPAIEQAGDLVNLYTFREGAQDLSPNSYADFLDMRERLDSIDSLVAYSLVMFNFDQQGLPTVEIGTVVSDGYFELLETRPVIGRLFTSDDFETQAPVVVVSHSFWQREFGSDTDAVGSTLRLDNQVYEVVGVLPEDFTGFSRGLVPNVFAPISSLEEISVLGESVADDAPNGRNFRDWRGYRFLSVTGRLSSNATLTQAEAEARAVASALSEEFPFSNQSRRLSLVETSRVRFDVDLDGVLVPGAMLLLGLVGLVLLVACVNVANLILAKAESRRAEVALRTALGASRWQIVRQLLVENAILGLFAGGIGLLVALIGIRLLGSIGYLLPIDPPFSLRLDMPVLLFTLGVSLATSLLFGLLPARQASRYSLVPALHSMRGSTTGPKRRFQTANTLVILQVAVSLVLVVTAGQLFRSISTARDIDLGFEADRIGNLSLDLSGVEVPADERAVLWQRIEASIETLPGIESVALTTRLPLGTSVNTNSFFIPGYSDSAANSLVRLDTTDVDGDYFATLGLELVEGRLIDERDQTGTEPVVVVTAAMERRYWPGESAIGKSIRVSSSTGVEFDVVGVVRDYKVRTPGEAPRPLLHFAWSQRPHNRSMLAYRSTLPADNMLEQVVAVVRAEAPDALILQSTTMNQMRDLILLPLRAGGAFAVGLGGLALFLSILGLSALIVYWVSRHRREIGLRMALGANRGSLFGLIVGRTMLLVALGAIIGSLGAVALGRLLQQILYVPSLDPVSLTLGVIVLILAGTLATVAPVRRATSIDPMTVLRQE